MSIPLRVLLVEDCEDDALLLVGELRRGGYEPTWERVDTATDLSAALARGGWELVLCDDIMWHFGGPVALNVIRAQGLQVPVIIVSGQLGENFAVSALKAGARDYVRKDNLARLVPAIERELDDAQLRRAAAVELYRAQEEEARLSAALARVGRELIASVDQPALLNTLCRLTTEVLGCDCSHTTFWDPIQQAYAVVAGFGDAPEQWEAMRVLKIPRAIVSGLLTRLQTDEVAQVVRDAPQGLLPSGMLQHYDITAGMYVALRRGDEIIGAQTAGYRGRTERFTPLQERIFRGIGQLASLALEHVRVVNELERANRLKYDFVATMSHELRSPLNVIMGYTDLLLEGEFGALGQGHADIFRRIDQSARVLLELIDAMLDLSRLEAGRLTLEGKDISLRDLFRDLDAETQELQQKPGLRFLWRVPRRAPRLHTDPLKLKVVMKNLIANAVKFTDHGSVTVSVAGRHGGVEITVSDTGVGIAPDSQSIIFEPFRQADSSMSRRYGGAGLGLYIVRRLVELMGGNITVESQLGHGATFRVWIPNGQISRGR